MYKLPYFTTDNEEEVLSFIKENSFAVVMCNADPCPAASQLPLILKKNEDGSLYFTGHLMRNTDHHKAFEVNNNVLVIFTGPHCYVSASWYDNPNVASTWNYLSVHVRGVITFTDEAGTLAALKEITDKYEGHGKPSSFENLQQEYISRLSKAVVGFKIEIQSIENVFKLSQNHNEATRESIISHLENTGDANSVAIAKAMKSFK